MLVIGGGLISNQANAQEKTNGKLYGKVVSDSCGQAIAKATVTIEGTKTSAKTDSKEAFSFDVLAAGTHTVVVKADGYQKWEKEVKVPAEDTRLQIKLKKSSGGY